ncbi:hypothetical protein H1D31_01360 [Alishewanella sp. BS5-314]|uniref:hypothetical protein n=1 Tax=Alishewanella sp. BS5-314 TaxID=2755587 RepID=UPI0021BA5F12|nr:hypothetical protein [Alishewanella sp. BS5-314]MCT8124685.1 hypothetical protein [Alishewanella sp. BS5-314]
MKKFITFGIGLVLILSYFHASASSIEQSIREDKRISVLWENRRDFHLASIKSSNELHKLESVNAWRSLSEEGKELFLESLVMNEQGLASFNYSILESELTVSEIHSILSMFGAQRLSSLMVNARVESDLDFLLISKPRILPRKDKDRNAEFSGLSYEDENAKLDDHKDYHCESRATCSERQGSICMSSC